MPPIGAALALGAALAAQPRIEVALPSEPIEFGRPFELTVVRTWPRDHAPQPFEVSALLPLAVREKATVMATAGDELVETRTFAAAAWQAGRLQLAALVLLTRDAGGSEHRAQCDVPPLMVASSLPEPVGNIEWPGDVRDRAAPPLWPYWLGAVALLAASGLAWRRFGRPSPPAAPVGPTGAERARAEIEALDVPLADAELEVYYIALAECVRRFCERQLGVRARVRTSEELVAVVEVGSESLADCLFRCDMVKFAANRPGGGAHAEARARALAFVEQAGGGAS